MLLDGDFAVLHRVDAISLMSTGSLRGAVKDMARQLL
jgi:hypothetical protein